MSIKFLHGDMFSSSAEALVNTVNCVGVMGKGVALEFKKRWPENYKFYKRACEARKLRPGMMLIFQRGDMFSAAQPRFIINFPTKDHWRSKSKLEFIEQGLDALVEDIARLGISSIAMPPLGCGNGGLDWGVVKPIIYSKLAHLAGVEVQVYAPLKNPEEPEYQDVGAKMTSARALFLKSIASVEPLFGGNIDRLSLQKVAYFLQSLGVPMRLDFDDNLYGPYSESLKKALITFNSWKYISGYKGEDRQIHVTGTGYAAAEDFLRGVDGAEDVVEKLLHLIEGYSSPYGLELLATAHYLINAGSASSEVVERMSANAPYRRNSFTPSEVKEALDRLAGDGLIAGDRAPKQGSPFRRLGQAGCK